VDSDCDDGLFCNGAETCDASGSCQAGMDPCAAGETCNEDTDSCDVVEDKVTLCHVAGKKVHTINVGAAAVPAHLAHGDTLGPCPE
jgi:hypothetical protein